jgi:hypothetical protein
MKKSFRGVQVKYIAAFAIIGLGLILGLITVLNPIATYSQVHSGLITSFSVDPNDYKTEPLMMTKGETVDFTLQLDNTTVFRFYIMNSSQLGVFEHCAPKCLQPLNGGKGPYYEQAGFTRPPLFLNITILNTAPRVDSFTAPTTGPYYFVFDNSEGPNYATYIAQNATGFTGGTFSISTYQIASAYAVNWPLAEVAIFEIIAGGVIATVIWHPKVRKLKPSRIDRFARKFGFMVAVVAILAILVFDAPIFYQAYFRTPISLPGAPAPSTISQNSGTTATGSGSTAINTSSAVQSYNVFEIDADYLSNVGPQGFGSLTVDNQDQFLYAATKQNNSIYIYDLPDEAPENIDGFNNPQSVLYVPQGFYQGLLYVTNAGNNTLDILSDNSTGGIFGLILSRIAEIALPNPGALAYDSTNNEVYVSCQNGFAVINANTSQEIGGVHPLPGTPAQIAVEQTGTSVFASIPNSSTVAVIDKGTDSVIANWPLPGTGNIPISLYEASDRLFVGVSSPPEIVVLDDNNGTVIARLPVSAVPGDITFDPTSGLVSASCVDGNLSSYQQVSPSNYVSVGKQADSVGGSRSIFFSAQEEILVVAPPSDGQPSQVYTFAIYAV